MSHTYIIYIYTCKGPSCRSRVTSISSSLILFCRACKAAKSIRWTSFVWMFFHIGKHIVTTRRETTEQMLNAGNAGKKKTEKTKIMIRSLCGAGTKTKPPKISVKWFLPDKKRMTSFRFFFRPLVPRMYTKISPKLWYIGWWITKPGARWFGIS